MLIAECCLRQRGLGLFGEGAKARSVMNGEIGKDLAVEFDTGLLESAHELAVAKAISVGTGADADDPERAVLALFLAASGVGELQCALNRLFCRSVQF